MREFKIFILEDSDSSYDQIKDHCDEIGSELEIGLQIEHFKDISAFLVGLQKTPPDLLVLDLRLNGGADRSGWEAINNILDFEVIPVLVYSGYGDEDPPEEKYKNLLIVRLVKSRAGELHEVLKNLILLKKRLSEEKEKIIGSFERVTLETIRKLLGSGTDFSIHEDTLAQIAVARLNSYLTRCYPFEQESGKGFPPEAIFIYPPLKSPIDQETLYLGDFLKNKEEGSLWVVASPSCDLLRNKIEEVLLLRCFTGVKEIPFLKNKTPDQSKGDLKQGYQRKTLRMYKCPERIFNSKYIVISFKYYQTFKYAEILALLRDNKWERLASLATPYAESFINHFCADFSRIGTPFDPDDDTVKEWITGYCSK